MSLIEFADFSFRYAGSPDAALKNIDLEINEGEILVVCGRSGSGKSTLLRCLKEGITPAGQITGRLISKLGANDTAVVFQDPETQLVCGSVMEDLAFYMENLGYTREAMRHNMAETVGFFSIEALLHRDPNELSGGQKQMVVLCAALMASPKLLLLDEPVSQLDPIAVRNFLDTLARINTELGVTIVLTEHRLDDCMTIADRLAVMDDGKILYAGETRQVLKHITLEENLRSMLFVPEIPRASLCFTCLTGSDPSLSENSFKEPEGEVCLTAKELRRCFRDRITPESSQRFVNTEKAETISPKGSPGFFRGENAAAIWEKLLVLKNVFFAYEESADYILRNLFLDLYRGECVCLVGGNGSGKTTLLKLICNIIKPLSGVRRSEKLRIAYMPQDIQSFFRFESVREELNFNTDGAEPDENLLTEFGLSGLLQRHPYDLSGGEASKLALCCILLKKPDLILLDEPTKGMDPYAKSLLSQRLKAAQAAVVCATHDLEFAARLATRCAMLFDGSISVSAAPREFFSRNQYYTTALGRAIRPFYPNAITLEDVMELCGKEASLFLRDSS